MDAARRGTVPCLIPCLMKTYYFLYSKGSTLSNLIKDLKTDIYNKVEFMKSLGALLLWVIKHK